MFNHQDIHNTLQAINQNTLRNSITQKQNIQQHINFQLQTIQQHLQQQVVVHNYGNVPQRAAARAESKAKAKSLALSTADRDEEMQGAN